MNTASFVPQSLRLELYAGDGAALKIAVNDPAGAPLPLTGTVSAQIRTNRQDTDPRQTFAVTVAGNEATLQLTGAQTAELGNFGGAWDCQWHAAGAEPRTLVQGPVFCSSDVSRG